MADKFDPYREALVIEVDTQWPEDHDDCSLGQRSELSRKLHEHPEEASHLEYIRTHTGFCRRIVVTDNDIERMG